MIIFSLSLVNNGFAQAITPNQLFHQQEKNITDSHYYFYISDKDEFITKMQVHFGAPKSINEDTTVYLWQNFGPKGKMWYTESTIFKLEWSNVEGHPDLKQGKIQAIGIRSNANYMHHKWGFVATFFQKLLDT